MRKLILVCGLWWAAHSWANAQYVTITDNLFADWLYNNGFDTCMINGNQLDTTCKVVTKRYSINIDGLQAQSVEGIQYFDSLRILNCRNNNLTGITALPRLLYELECSNNQLNSLPDLPATLRKLTCGNNNLSALPALPANLFDLRCSLNEITALPALPLKLNTLWCNYNQLTSLPALPDSLRSLWCYVNNLTTIPPMPKGLTTLSCTFNQIISLPELPDSLGFLDLRDNPIACLPAIKIISEFNFDNTNITCLPAYQKIIHSNPPYDTIPLCNTLNPNPCEGFTGEKLLSVNTLTLSLFPNPASTQLTITLSEQHNGSTLTLTDLTGRVVLKSEITNLKSDIHIAELPGGIYLAALTTPGGLRAVSKVVKE